jgi:uncharacterized membrane protein YhaH (DUF805 family)
VDLFPGNVAEALMDWTTLLFGFTGRINRSKYWLAFFIWIVAWVGLSFIWTGILVSASRAVGLSIYFATLVCIFLGAWSGLAVGVKRLHDREKSGWWILLFWLGPSALSGWHTAMPNLGGGFVLLLAAAAIAIWALIELGCLRGTLGQNKYGRDPLGGPPPLAPQP